MSRSGLAMAAGASLLVLHVQDRAGAQTVLPQGGAVVSGQARIGVPAGNALTVTQSSSRAVVDWSSFSVGQAGSVTFVQPDMSAAILNRVTGATPSTIAGRISADGQVFLVNPNGIAITPTGVVKVGGGFVGSTLDLSAGDFMAGRRAFTGNGASAAVSNAGTIATADGGIVALIGGTVSNTGTIRVPLGRVGLASGEQVTINPTGDGFLQVAVATSAVTADGKALVDVAGRIRATGGTVELKAATVAQAVRDAVNVSGSLSARSVFHRNGMIVLDGGTGGNVTVSGKLAASGGRRAAGGTIVATGRNVKLASGARLDASGTTGGNVLIGGDLRGGFDPGAKLARAPVRNAQSTTVEQGAVIEANGTAGAGGNVVLWSDASTGFRGTITATGAGQGAGGAVEVSTHGVLGYAGAVDVTAASGRTGTLLLDPFNVTISTDPDSGAGFTATANDTVINTTTLENALASANVTVSTGAGGTQNGDITVANAVTWASGNMLALNAAGAVNVNASITATNGGSLTMTGATIAVTGTTITTSGTLSATATASGAVTAVTLTNATIDVGTGTGTISGTTSTGNGVSFSGSSSLTAGSGGSLTVSGSNTGSTVLAGMSWATSAALTSGGNVTLDGTSSSFIGILLNGSNAVTASSGNLTLNGNATSDAGLQLRGTETITNSGGGTIALSGTTSTYRGVEIFAGANITLSGNATIAGTSTSGPGTLFSAATFTLSSGTLGVTGSSTSGVGLRFAGTTVSNAGSGALTITGTSSTNQAVLFTNSDSLANTGAGSLSVSGTSGSNRGLQLNASTSLTTSGDMTLSGTTTSDIGTWLQSGSVTASSGNLTMTGTSSSGTGLKFTGTFTTTNAGLGTASFQGTSGTGAGLGLDNSASLTTSGTIALAGTATSASGFKFLGGSSLTASAGDLTVTGTSTSGAGAEVAGSNTITNGGAGTLSVSGTTSTGSGLLIDSSAGLTTSGPMTLSGTSDSGVGAKLAGTNGITDSAGSLTITATSTSNAGMQLNGGSNTLTNSGAGTFSLSGTSGSTTGFALNASTTLGTSGSMALSGTSTSGIGFSLAGSSSVTASSGSLTLAGTSSSATALQLAATSAVTNNGSGTLTLNVSGGADLGATISSSSGPLVLSGTGGIAQSAGTVTAGDLLLSGASGNFTLNASGNSIGTLAANVSSVALNDNSALTIGTVLGTSGVTASGSATLVTSSDLTIASGAPVSATSPVLAAAGAFVNNDGSGAATATSGRWLVYSSAPGSDTFGSLDSSNTAIWNATYASLPSGSASPTGNRYLFANQPTLTFTSTNASKTYGVDASASIASSFTVSGYRSAVANAYLADSSATAYGGAPSITSTGAAPTATVAGSPYTISGALGSLASTAGYAFAFQNNGQLTVNAASVTVMALGGSSTYGSSPANPGLSATGLQNGESVNVLTGLSNSFGISNATNAGGTTLSVAGALTNANYTVASTNTGSWTVNPASVTVTALGGSSSYGASPANPGLSATGLQNGETVSVLTGLSNSFGISNATNAGGTTLNVAGALINSNYTVASTNTGSWTVNPASVTVTALGGSSPYGSSPANPGLSATGLKNGQNASVLNGLSSSFGITNTTVVGSYPLNVVGTLTNANYTLAATQSGFWTVTPTAPVSYRVADANAAFGAPRFGTVTLIGVIPGDMLFATVAAFMGSSQVAIGPNTAPGIYTMRVTGFTGPAAAHYTLAPAGNASGTLTIIGPPAATQGPSLATARGALGSYSCASQDALSSLGALNGPRGDAFRTRAGQGLPDCGSPALIGR